MAAAITRAWKRTAKTSLTGPLNQLLSRKATPKRIDNFVAKLGVALKTPLTAAQAKVIEQRLRQIWDKAKRIAAKEAKAQVSFSLVDTRAVAALNRQQVFWVGDFYSTHLSDRIRAVSGDVLIQQGLPQQEAGVVLRRAMQQEFGLTIGGRSKYAPNVPARYAGNPDHYFRQVASTSAHQSRTFGKLVAFQDAGIVRYRLINPNDERTGRICQQMHDQVFTVDVGVKHMNRLLNAKDPKDVKKIAPWLSGEELEQQLAGARRGSRPAADALAASGAILPPFHALCRTEPVVE